MSELRAHIAAVVGLDAEQAREYDWFHASDRQVPFVLERLDERGAVLRTFRFGPAQILDFEGSRYAASWNDEARCVVYWTYEDVVRGLGRSIRENLPQGYVADRQAEALAGGMYGLDREGNPEPVE